MTVQRLRPATITDPYSGLPTKEDWSNPTPTNLTGYAVAWESSSENPTVNRETLTSQAKLVRPGGVALIEVLTTDRIRALGHDWDVSSHAMPAEYLDLLGVGLINGSTDAGTTWNLTLREG